jgi:hypothetical protein
MKLEIIEVPLHERSFFNVKEITGKTLRECVSNYFKWLDKDLTDQQITYIVTYSVVPVKYGWKIEHDNTLYIIRPVTDGKVKTRPDTPEQI